MAKNQVCALGRVLIQFQKWFLSWYSDLKKASCRFHQRQLIGLDLLFDILGSQ